MNKPRPGDRVFNIPDALRELFDGTTFSLMGGAIADCIDRDRVHMKGDPYHLALDAALAALKTAANLKSAEQYAQQPTDDPARCPRLTIDGQRCIMPADHTGDHAVRVVWHRVPLDGPIE